MSRTANHPSLIMASILTATLSYLTAISPIGEIIAAYWRAM
ncbi:hypothetical protein [Aureimonas fodinaquatilis]|nr:hypothetical protein [Aureimonas fodinaquatilis]